MLIRKIVLHCKFRLKNFEILGMVTEIFAKPRPQIGVRISPANKYQITSPPDEQAISQYGNRPLPNLSVSFQKRMTHIYPLLEATDFGIRSRRRDAKTGR